MLLALLSLFLLSTTAEYFAPNSPLRELARGAFLNSWPVTNVPVEYCTTLVLKLGGIPCSVGQLLALA